MKHRIIEVGYGAYYEAQYKKFLFWHTYKETKISLSDHQEYDDAIEFKSISDAEFFIKNKQFESYGNTRRVVEDIPMSSYKNLQTELSVNKC